MKNRILNHFGMKVLSFLIAFVIWVVVANVDDYKTTKQISGIEIEFINGDAITEKNKVYEVPESSTIDIVVKGRRSVVETLDDEDFRAVADLSKMSVTNAVTVEVSAISSSIGRDLTISYTNDSVTIAVEDKIEKQLPITVRASSEVADGYAIKNKVATPNLITIKGAESVIDTIEEAVVDVDVAGASHNLTAYGEPVFLDHHGDVVDATKFEYDVDSVDIMVEISQTKELSVKIKTTGNVASGYEIASIDYQPTSILVIGEASDLAKVEEIVIDDVDVTDCKDDMEAAIAIADYLPSGINVADNTEEIMVKVIIEPVEERSMHIDVDDINIIGKTEGYQYNLTSASGYTIKVSGLKDKLQDFKVANLIPSIDVTGYEPGTHTFTVSLREISGITVLENLVVELEIISNEE